MAKKFKYSLTDLYSMTDEMVREIKEGTLSEIQKDFVIGDLLEVTNELINNNCKRFMINNNADELEKENLFALATGIALFQALENFTFEKGVHFLTFWNMIMQRHFINEFQRNTSMKGKFYQINCCSSDVELDGEGNTIIDYTATGEDVAEEICERLTLDEVIERFEAQDKHGKIIRCLTIGTTAIKRKAILHVLGVDTYGANERKAVQRVKARFKKFLAEQNFEVI